MHEQADEERIGLTSQLRYRAVGGDGVLVHLANGRVLVVNEVGLHIVQRLDKLASRNELVSSVAETFDVSADQAEADLETYLAELDAEQVLERPPS